MQHMSESIHCALPSGRPATAVAIAVADLTAFELPWLAIVLSPRLAAEAADLTADEVAATEFMQMSNIAIACLQEQNCSLTI